MFDTLKRLLSSARSVVSSLDQAPLSDDDAVSLVELFAELERLSVAGRSLASRRVAESKIWQREGHRTAADWVAAKTGSKIAEARDSLQLARRLEELPALRHAFTSGALSHEQAHAVSAAAWIDPASERALVDAARTKPLQALKRDCQAVHDAAVVDDIAAYKRVHEARYFKTWREGNAIRCDGRFTVDDGAILESAVAKAADKIFAQARKQGRRESAGAYAADALITLARNAANRSASSNDADAPVATEVSIVIDYETFITAKRSSDSRCEIPGVGPIPAATARAMAGDSFLKFVVMKAEDIQAVVHFGRTIPARVRSGLKVRDPHCQVPDCTQNQHLEIDHWRIDFAHGGPSSMDNLVRICRFHHRQKTLDGYRLTGGPGKWRWHPPGELHDDDGIPVPDE